jgi:phage/plasmid-like protein (TIGR03299 family)
VPADVDNMVSTRGMTPWHGLGTVLNESVITADQALKLGGMDWQVDMFPQPVRIDRSGMRGSEYVEDIRLVETDTFATVRSTDDFVLGSGFSSRYTPIQNREAFAFFDAVVRDREAKYETAGTLNKGRVVFLTAKLAKDIMVGGVDKVDTYLVFATSHDGSMAFKGMVTPVRVVCRNTLNLASQQATQQFTVRHTGKLDGKLDEARRALGITFEYLDDFQKKADLLIQQEMTKKQFEELVRAVFPDKEAEKNGFFTPEQATLISNLESSPTLDDSFRYTKWGALNAIGERYEWGKRFRVGDDRQAESRVMSSVFGGEAEKARDKTLKYLLKV